ncbi:transforming growth factor-beta-induced protein ig-h3-like [Babylonia areolata]|uniref:transforming growth factor-beta-induced protein ig-h3-like n=1 Tax=Babylonia areolata TaxID=304850 RepID=UPI003FD268BA
MAVGIDFRTVMGYINDNPELSTLKGLLEKANLDIALESPGAITTVFAPSNAAFSKLPSYILQQVQSDPVLLQKTLLTHVLGSAFISIFLVNEHVETTLSGLPLRDSDIVLRNGIIHIIDDVILPAEGDILHQILIDDAEFEDLIAALAVTNLLEDLEIEAITVFAPLNSAFQAYFDKDNMPDNLDIVKDVLMNHIVNGTYYPVGLNTGDQLTSLSGHTLDIGKTASGEITVNGKRTDGVIYATNVLIVLLAAGSPGVWAQDSRTIFQYLQDEGYNRFLELVLGAGLSAEFMDTQSMPITLFAPTDAAFDSVPQDVLAAIQTNGTYLRTVLDGHVSEQTVLGLFIRDGLTKTSKSGTTLRFSVFPNGVKTVNGAVIGGDIILANGLVHTIDKVLVPLDRSISAIVAENDSQFRDLFGFLVLAKLFGTLSMGGPFTVFAPDDTAFANVDIAGLITNRTALEEVLKDHVVSGMYWSAGLTDGMTLPTLGGSNITIKIGPGVAANNAQVTTADIGASNGVIHVIDSVITTPA